MDSVLDLACGHADGPRASTLLVMLPGAYDTPQDFLREGFVSAVRAQQLAVDVQLVDAHVSLYMQQAILPRLQQEVIAPAREAGYREIWLAGISIGGLGALLYGATHPSEINGVVALAPYLGPRNISMGVERAGGLAHWPSEAHGLPDDETDRQLWLWLKARAAGAPGGQQPGSDATTSEPWPLFWGYGHTDRFAHAHRLVAQGLPAERVFTVEGGHDWPAWIGLWRQMLGQLPWPALAARPAD
jgi:S-formylglutathione hydrolase FrmB